MLDAGEFVAALRRRGFGLFSGVPCSYLAPLINRLIDASDVRYVGAANEGDALAIACGAWLGGVRSAVLFQNSGLGNAVNPVASLALPARLPTLVLSTWRGEPGGAPDEPQHELMGRITPDLFTTIGIPCERLAADPTELEAALERALAHLEAKRTPYAFLLSKGTFAPYRLATAPPTNRLPTPAEPFSSAVQPAVEPDAALAAIRAGAGTETALVATTGFTGRALYRLGDRPNQLYMVGSMGCAPSLALGLALARPERRFVVIDGDGALLMRMGALATIGFEAPRNLVHVLLDNGVHDSTGGQSTVSRAIDLAGVAAACGYAAVRRISNAAALEAALREELGGPVFLHVHTQPRRDGELPRPALSPDQVVRRFADWVGSPA
jgi:phosphonopyruvate decarboxylase